MTFIAKIDKIGLIYNEEHTVGYQKKVLGYIACEPGKESRKVPESAFVQAVSDTEEHAFQRLAIQVKKDPLRIPPDRLQDRRDHHHRQVTTSNLCHRKEKQ